MICGRWARLRWVLVALLLLAWALRLPPLLHSSLHSDEALYGYWGLLIGHGRDPWLTSAPVDKPPLLPYALAGFQLLLEDAKVALRLPGLAAGMLTVPLTASLAHRLYGDRGTGAMAAIGVALSPFTVVFSGTAFPDPAMVALGTAACLAAVRGEAIWAGFLAALSLATKQTGLVWVLLSVLLLALARRSPGDRRPLLLPFIACLGLGMGVVLAWDVARGLQGAPSFWQAGVVGYGGLRPIWPQELWPRLLKWLRLLRYLFPSPAINGLSLLGLPVLVGVAVFRHLSARHALIDVLLVAFLLIYAIFHWLVAFPIWDRYLVPMVPVAAVLLGRIVRATVSHLRFLAPRQQSMVGCLVLVVFLILPALQASAGPCPVGQEHAAYEGIDDVTSFLAGLPEGAVVYHHWLGHHYRYALWDAPIYLAYWPHPAWLARDVQAFGSREPRYVTFPAWESSARVERYLDEVGYMLSPALSVAHTGGHPAFIVYRLLPSSD